MPNLCIFPARALEDPSLSGSDIRVLAAIGKFTDRAGSGCWASSKTLATVAGVSRSSFFASTERLLTAGLILRESRKHEGKQSEYSIVFDTPKNNARGVHQARVGVSTPLDTPVSPLRHWESARRDTATINAPVNVPSIAPITGGGSKGVRLKKAGELINRLRGIRAYPSGIIQPRFQSEFTEKEREVVKAAGIDVILNTPQNSETSLRWQLAEMLGAA